MYERGDLVVIDYSRYGRIGEVIGLSLDKTIMRIRTSFCYYDRWIEDHEVHFYTTDLKIKPFTSNREEETNG